MPPQAADILGREMKKGLAPVDPARLERAMLARLRLMNEHDFASYDSGGEGLYRRVYRAVQEGGSLGDILTRTTTKRYPTARVRRMLWAVFLGLEAPGEDIPYVRILAATEAGRRLLRQMQDAGVPVLTKAAVWADWAHRQRHSSPGGPPDGCIRPGMPRLPPPLRQ